MEEINIKAPAIHTVYISEFDMEAIKVIRNYFLDNDKTGIEHLAYAVLNRIYMQAKSL